MDVRSLACFVAVAEELHFGRAAERMHLTQPALSQRVQALETEVGAMLFDRDRRRVTLTPAGAAFLEPARVAVANIAAAKARALAAMRGEIGRLRLGFTGIAFHGFLPEAVRSFRGRFPDIAVELAEMSSPAIEAALTGGEIDFGVLHPPLAARDLVVHPLLDEELLLALPQAHPLAGRPAIKVTDLDGEPFLIAPRSIGPSLYDRIIALFRSEGITPRIVQEVTPMTSLAGLVAASAGMGLVTAGIAMSARPGVAYRPLIPAAPRLPLAAAWRPPALPPAGKHFLEILSETSGGGRNYGASS